MDGQIFPLAADFTVPLAVMLDSTNPKKFERARLLNPGKYAETARISRLQPYDPNKIVVLVIHGLMDTPATWTPMLNRLLITDAGVKLWIALFKETAGAGASFSGKQKALLRRAHLPASPGNRSHHLHLLAPSR